MQSARQTLKVESNNIIDESLRLDDPRFFVQMGWDVLHTDTAAVPNRYFLRGEVTPLRSWMARENIYNIREGELIPGTEERDPSGTQVVYGKYWRRAKFEAERLIDNENNATYKTGLVEVQALRDVPHVYMQVDLNAVLYPDGLDKLPVTNKELVAHLTARIPAIEADNLIPMHFKPTVLAVVRELITAAENADTIQRSRLQYVHSCMKLTPGEEGFKREYDFVDREMLKRTGVPEVHSTDVNIANTLAAVTARASSDNTGAGLAELAHVLKDMVQQNQALMGMLAASKPTPKKVAKDADE